MDRRRRGEMRLQLLRWLNNVELVSGQSLAEYTLLLVLILLVALSAMSFLGSQLSVAFANVVNNWP